MDTHEETFPIKAPTQAQLDYAGDLVQQLRDANQFEAEKYARGIERCYDRRTMSRYISEMKELVEEERSFTGRYQQPRKGCKGC